MKKNKRILFIVLLFVALMIPSIVNAANEMTTTVNGVPYSYTLNESEKAEELKCLDVTKISGTYTVPTKVDGYEVIALASNAFEDATNLTSVTLPSCVKEVGYAAFRDCKNITVVNLGSIESIGGSVFEGCVSLTSIKIPKTLKENTSISYSPFNKCTNLTNITFETGLTVIPGHLCATTGITEVIIPSSVKTIEYKAFEGCTNLTKVVIPLSVKSIGSSVFEDASSKLVLHVIKNSAGEKYAMTEKLNYISSRISISKCKISGIETKVYNGSGLKQAPLVKYEDIVLIYGTDYTISYSNNVKPGKATMKITGKGTYTGTVSKTFKIRPGKVSGVKTKTYGTDYVSISWSKATGATGYTVYKYDEKAKAYKGIGTTKSTAVKIKGLKANKTYKFRVKAYKTIDGSKYQGAYSSTLTTGTKPKTSKISSVKSKSSKKATIKWKKVTGASGYEVYMATSKKGKYSRVKRVTKGSTVSYTKSSLKKKKTYYFKVRAYKTINGKKVYSSYSSVKSVKVK